MRSVLALRMGKDERELLEAAAQERGVSLGSYVRDAALAAARADLEPAVDDPEAEPVELAPQAGTAVPVDADEEAPARSSLLHRVFRSADGDVEASEARETPAETPLEMMRRIWREPGPWREAGVDPADGHRHSNVERVPGSMAHPFTWPPIGSPESSEESPD
jgi:hypothetical protein